MHDKTCDYWAKGAFVDDFTDDPNSIENADPKDMQVGGNHYIGHKIQPWDVIEEYELDYFEGNVLKYLLRRKVNRLEDLRKAAHYLAKAIQREEGRANG